METRGLWLHGPFVDTLLGWCWLPIAVVVHFTEAGDQHGGLEKPGTLVATTLNLDGGKVYAFAILFFGALHILYDGFVWKLRRPNVAASLGISPVALPVQ
jgi:hypothetical protein